jgi:hypothetical protein
VYINETGLYSLILSSQAPFAKEYKENLKSQIEKWIVDLRDPNSGVIDIFNFIKGYNLTFDISSSWYLG